MSAAVARRLGTTLGISLILVGIVLALPPVGRALERDQRPDFAPVQAMPRHDPPLAIGGAAFLILGAVTCVLASSNVWWRLSAGRYNYSKDCHRCGYSLKGCSSPVCPECGTPR